MYEKSHTFNFGILLWVLKSLSLPLLGHIEREVLTSTYRGNCRIFFVPGTTIILQSLT